MIDGRWCDIKIPESQERKVRLYFSAPMRERNLKAISQDYNFSNYKYFSTARTPTRTRPCTRSLWGESQKTSPRRISRWLFLKQSVTHPCYLNDYIEQTFFVTSSHFRITLKPLERWLMFTSQCPSDTSVLYSSANSRSLIIMEKKIQSNRDISGCPESSWQRAFYQGMRESSWYLKGTCCA